MKKTIALLLLAAPFVAAHAFGADGLEAGKLGITEGTAAPVAAPANDARLVVDTFSLAPTREWNMNLGRGYSVSSFSSIPTPYDVGVSLGSAYRLMPAFSSSLAMQQPGTYLGRTYNDMPTQFGGVASKDLGGGVSLNLIGGVSKFGVGGSFADPALGLAMTPQSETYTRLGGGVTFNMGGGSSLSLTGTVAKSSYGGLGVSRCAGASFALCR